jgi:hypothetical protein
MARRAGSLGASAALHIAILVAASSRTMPPSATAPAAKPRVVDVFVVPPVDDSGPAGLNPLDPTDDNIRRDYGSTTVKLPGFEYNVAKIKARATLLFPFVTPGLSLGRFGIAPHPELRDGFHDPLASVAAADKSRGSPPLVLSDAALQALVDDTWSRRDRWPLFRRIEKIAETHHPDAGKLPALLHEYQAQNGLQPYLDASIRDPRLWTELGLAADHVEFIGFISRFASQHPSTKATTELLFLLDKLAQASFDALVTLLDTMPDPQLRWTHDANRGAYDFIVDIRHHYANLLVRKGLSSSEALAAHFDKVRLDILAGILRTTPGGYRANDARFLIGSVYWRQQNIGGALRTWRAMTVDRTDGYAASIARILSAIATHTGGDRGDVDTRETTRLLAADIERILRAEHGRWIMFSMDRLKQFGFHFDTF